MAVKLFPPKESCTTFEVLEVNATCLQIAEVTPHFLSASVGSVDDSAHPGPLPDFFWKQPANYIPPSGKVLEKTPNEWIFLVEEDIQVNVKFLNAWHHMSRAFETFQRKLGGAKLSGISLMPPRHDYLHLFGEEPVHIHALPAGATYALQQPQTVAGLYPIDRWWELRARAEQRFAVLSAVSDAVASAEAIVPAPSLISELFKDWPEITRLSMAELGQTMLYPLAHNTFAVQKKPLAYLPPLVSAPILDMEMGAMRRDDQHSMPAITHLFDMTKQSVQPKQYNLNGGESATHQPLAPVDMQYFGKCTLVLTVFSRYHYVLERLAWYADFAYLKSIVVVWNQLKAKPPHVKASWFRIPVSFVAQKMNSMNNRFKPSHLIDTECVINMDDDWDMPFPVMEYAVRVWHAGFQNNLVGLWANGRAHGKQLGNVAGSHGGWRYRDQNDRETTVASKHPKSIVLPSGMVYHKRYLEMYTNQLPPAARILVNKLTNCDDILFNFMVANATGSAPVFIGTEGMPGVHAMETVTAKGDPSGLYNRKQHVDDRSRCIANFADMFGGMKLKYTETVFHVLPGFNKIPDPGFHRSRPCAAYAARIGDPTCYLSIAQPPA